MTVTASRARPRPAPRLRERSQRAFPPSFPARSRPGARHLFAGLIINRTVTENSGALREGGPAGAFHRPAVGNFAQPH